MQAKALKQEGACHVFEEQKEGEPAAGAVQGDSKEQHRGAEGDLLRSGAGGGRSRRKSNGRRRTAQLK